MSRLPVASAIAVVLTLAFLPGSGLGSQASAARGAHAIPRGLAAAIHARFGAGPIRVSASAHETEGAYFGWSVSVSADGTTALVSAPAVSHEAGAAYVFHVANAGAWTSSDTPTATLTLASGAQVILGWQVALSPDGTTAFIDAPIAGGGQNRPGAIYVYHVASEDAWTSSSTPTAALTAQGSVNLGIGGMAVSTDGTTLIVGAPYYNEDAGGAYVFQVASEDAWVTSSSPTAVLTVPNESRADEYVGGSVALSGDGTTALLGDAGNPDSSTTTGGAYVYHVAAEDAWTSSTAPAGRLSDAAGGLQYLGFTLALSGDGTVAVVGAEGAVDVFHTASAATWAATATPTATLTGGAADHLFGGVAASTDGTTVLATGIQVTQPSSNYPRWRAASYVFHVADEGAWASSSAATATLIDASIPPGHNSFGYGVLSGDGATVLTGDAARHFETGVADVFHAPDAASWASSSAPTAVLTNAALARCVVPRLKGLTVPKAKKKLKERSCRLGRITKVSGPKNERRHVVTQTQRPGWRLPVGAKVAVAIGK